MVLWVIVPLRLMVTLALRKISQLHGHSCSSQEQAQANSCKDVPILFGQPTKVESPPNGYYEEIGGRSREIAFNPADTNRDIKETQGKQKGKFGGEPDALNASEAAQVEAMSAILKNEENMDAMVAYARNKDPKNKKGKAVSEKYCDLSKSMSPAVKERVRLILLETIKFQYKKDAKTAEKLMQDTLGNLFPDLLQDFFATHDYNKGKGPEK